MTNQVAHPMEQFQVKLSKLVEANLLKPSDGIWKAAFLYGDQWHYWKQELFDFGFTTQDPVSEVLAVEIWDEE